MKIRDIRITLVAASLKNKLKIKKLNEKSIRFQGVLGGGRIKLPSMKNAIIILNIHQKKNLKKVDNFSFYN